METKGIQLAIRGLRGLGGVYLVIEGIAGPDETAGMTESLLREDAQSCLRGMGLAPMGAGEWLSTAGAPHLYVRVEVAQAISGGSAGVAVAVQVREKVSLERAPEVKVMAPVWGSQRVSHVDGADLQEGIRCSVGALLAEFVEAYERANAA